MKLFWPVALALTAGIYLGIQFYPTDEEARIAAAHREVGDQARLMTETFWSQVDSIRSQTLAFRQLRLAYQTLAPNSEAPKPWGRIQHWAEFALRGESLGPLKLYSHGINWKPGPVERAEETYLRILQEKISVQEIQDNGVSLIRIKLDPLAASEKLALGFFADTKNSMINVVMVDPAEVFPIFKRFAPKKEEGSLRAYLVGSDGRVLIHSQASYNATNFSDTQVFSQALRPLLEGTRGNGAGSFVSIDQIPVYSAFSRLGKLPLAVVVERAALAPVASAQAVATRSSVRSGQKKKNSANGILIGGVLVAGIALLVAMRKLRRDRVPVEKQVHERDLEKMLDALEGTPKSVLLRGAGPSAADASGIIMGDAAIAAGPPIPIQNEEAVRVTLERELVASQQALKTAQQERQLLNRFELEAATLKDPKIVSARLTQAATELCGSPTLFFAHHETLGSAILQSDAGFPVGSAPVAMSFPVDSRVLAQILDAAKQGGLTNLSEYEPLARILMNRIGVAHFEAWPLTGFGHLGRQSGRARLLGILVILQAGVDSVTRHDSLCRMMRMTGLVYENSLLTR